MYEQIRDDVLFSMFYAVVTALSMLASCYLLLRRGNVLPLTSRRQYACAGGLPPSLQSWL